ncbi:dihydrolipoyllysine-residue succinyltransferase component of 2-oxoglutarate dehydrogenase complex 1, mitochondrial-like [Olea europaea var. sylvestris]|uniref:dihydrolipoyllysine-residue succinyltransferase component of 2-oxoglutarate dehydrogenase complex 1, mitochondrial-like n=1 Tax=Olea europaea var. sylvestris TaxID=158386 RepID=UPI000C1D28AA|nr:dihydrolipoyllysine-residue succinyltransferase component of 2-oxoglutarate dehydrogenase complex 1, mitochondrial-like [Olea europaea var. sylvestris]
MLGVLRRKAACSASSSASVLGKSLRKIRPATPRVCSSLPEEIIHHPRGFGNARTFCHLPLVDCSTSLRPTRAVVTNLPQDINVQIWSRSFSSNSEGDLVDAVVPHMGESITDGTLAAFLKKPGDRVAVDEPIAQVETDKVTIDVNSPEAGVIREFVAKEGDTVEPGTKIAVISKSAEGVTHVAPSDEKSSEKAAPLPSPPAEEKKQEPKPKVETAPVTEKPKETSPPKPSATEPQLPPKDRERRVSIIFLLLGSTVDLNQVLLIRYLWHQRVHSACLHWCMIFDLWACSQACYRTNLMKLRSDYKDAFVEKHGVKLGLMSGFVKAAVSALQNQPIVNAVIDGDDIIYRDYIDISIAVGTPKGLVVPVLRDAGRMNFAEVEKEINTLAKKATDGTISIDEMAGGTFTISNGGVYGSLLSTPIINPPQSAILGMHSIVNRPMVVGGNIVPRPMMYIALTYDHRLIDGREAVFFLRRIKDVVEDPRRLLLDI